MWYFVVFQPSKCKKTHFQPQIWSIWPIFPKDSESLPKFCYIKRKNSEILSKLRNSEPVGVSGWRSSLCLSLFETFSNSIEQLCSSPGFVNLTIQITWLLIIYMACSYLLWIEDTEVCPPNNYDVFGLHFCLWRPHSTAIMTSSFPSTLIYMEINHPFSFYGKSTSS